MFLYSIKRFYLFLIILFLFSCNHKSSEKVFIPTGKKIEHTRNYYKKAERITYSAQYGVFHVGDIVIETSKGLKPQDNIPCYHVKVSSVLSGSVGFVFSINDSWESFVDTTSLLPYKFSKSLRENKYRKTDYTIFDRTLEKAFVTDTTSPHNPELHNYSITPTIEDMISSFFLLRNVPFEQMKVNDTAIVDVFMDDRCYNIRVKLLGEEKIKVKSKRYKAYVITTAIAEVESEEHVKCWISADEKRIPLKVRLKLPVISAELELKEYKSN